MELVHDFKQEIYGIAINSEDSLFIANVTNNSLDFISFVEGEMSAPLEIKLPATPYALAFWKEDLYITASYYIMKMKKDGNLSKIAGNGRFGIRDGFGESAQLTNASGICFDERGIAYFCDNNNHCIRKLTAEGAVTTLCGSVKGFRDGKGADAKFANPSGITYNKEKKTFFITDFNSAIRTMSFDGTVGTSCKYSDSVHSIVIDGQSNLYVSTEFGIITIDYKGEIKVIQETGYANGMTFNRKGDLFISSWDRKLYVIRNCTQYPPNPLFSPLLAPNAGFNQFLSNTMNSVELLVKAIKDMGIKGEFLEEEIEKLKLENATLQAQNEKALESHNKEENKRLRKENESLRIESENLKIQKALNLETQEMDLQSLEKLQERCKEVMEILGQRIQKSKESQTATTSTDEENGKLE